MSRLWPLRCSPNRSEGGWNPRTPPTPQVLRVGRNQLYQAVTRGELGAVRIGRSIRIPKHALLDLLAAAGPPTASGDE
jgi:excisionase family DNA binding protein